MTQNAKRLRKKLEECNQKGVCQRCGKVPPFEGKKSCLGCSGIRSETAKRLRDSRRIQKLCTLCGNPSDESVCDNCYKKINGHPRLNNLQDHTDWFFKKSQNAHLDKAECILTAEKIVKELELKVLNSVKDKTISKFTIGVSTADEGKKAGRLFCYKEYAHSSYVTSNDTDAVALAEAIGYFKFQNMFGNVSKQDPKALTHLPIRNKTGVLYLQFNVSGNE